MRRSAVVGALAVVATGMAITATPASALTASAPVSFGTYAFTAKVSMADRACSGVLVAPAWVLTAASCFPENAQGGAPTAPATVVIGRTDLSGTSGTVAQVAKLVPSNGRNAMLAKLDRAVAGVAPIALATTPAAAGDTVRLTGYGRTETEWVPNVLRTTTFSVASTDAASLTLTGVNGADACKGDAGGPVFREGNGKTELVGITTSSWQHGCLGSTETRQGTVGARTDDLATRIGQQTAPSSVTCRPVLVWSARSDGNLWLYQHNDPTGGTFSWVQPQNPIGNGWFGRMLAGPHGVVWDIHRALGGSDPYHDGDLKRWVWDGHNWSGGNQVGSGWQPFLAPENANKVTVDSQGRIYEINAAGELRVFVWNETTNSWENGVGQVLDTGWGRFNSITAAGDGVLYARTPSGVLTRFEYSFGTGRWLERDEAAGAGWEVFSEIFSPGADILYGRGHSDSSGPVLRWYRHDDNTATWAAGAPDGFGKVVGTGWNTEIHVSADPSACTIAPR
ncbi:tachylectin-related carbohydrate-binding protein [Kutzneria chonburiensis]|uniref:Tachylectin-related carbohydrate-binding protein n=1 Tax=Kutzneria chonburiensis TaxID=1483604 RepID=A0ABV6MMU0_9PSEU|nr:tachylectin-related carbohydrate-binding protein [Kutzneria chonburiensis]